VNEKEKKKKKICSAELEGVVSKQASLCGVRILTYCFCVRIPVQTIQMLSSEFISR